MSDVWLLTYFLTPTHLHEALYVFLKIHAALFHILVHIERRAGR